MVKDKLDMSEKETRKKYITPELIKGGVGWKSRYFKEEVNSIKSDFVSHNYVLFNKSVEKGVDRFIDYLLLNQDDSPLAIIEAKKFSKDPEEGRIQARTYQKDIASQLNGKLIPIFLTNGEIWRFIDQHGRERDVSGPFSQEDLERRNALFYGESDPSKISIKIVDRDRSQLNVLKVLEHFNKGHRKALIQMATGTGKTRVAMALIDSLVKAKYVTNVLFIADRIALADQASAEGFKQFFREPVCELHRTGFSTTARFYATTVQTLMGREGNRMVDKFSPAYFDLIIFDEAHRSQHDKYNYIHQYFDAIKIGLTATPKKEESRNTYHLFDCEVGVPTVEYSYEDAVRDSVLVPFLPLVIETENLKLGIIGKELSEDLKDQLKRQEVDPDYAEFAGSQFERVFIDDKTNELIVSEFMRECYKSAEGLPCKTIFFCRSQKHAKRMKKAFGNLFPNLGNHVQVITSDYRVGDEVKRFKQRSEPRVALSVGMLDTGVDIPEVCNLVFIGPVYSPIRFWQMLGRGTRNFKSCKHPEWLPVEDEMPVKKGFLLMDFQLGEDNNITLHALGESKERSPSKHAIARIFENRVNLLEKELSESQKDLIQEKIKADINQLNEASFIVREKRGLLRILKGSFNLKEYISKLHEEITPLMVMTHGSNPKITPFILTVEKAFNAILDNNHEQIETIKQHVWIRLDNILLKESKINEIKAKKDIILQVLHEKYWDDLTFPKVELIIKELSPLLKYFEEEPMSLIEVSKQDTVISRTRFAYHAKEDKNLENLLKNNLIVSKIKNGEGITCNELKKLENELTKLNPAYTIENVQGTLNKDFFTFLYEIIGLTHKYDPRELIEKEFNKHILENKTYNSRQLEFLLLLKKVFSNRKFIELKDFAQDPFKDENPIELFNGVKELEKIVAKCQVIKMK